MEHHTPVRTVEAPPRLLLVMVVVLALGLSGCASLLSRGSEADAEPHPFARLQTGEVRTGPWRIVIPATWSVTTVHSEDTGTPGVRADGGQSGIAYRVEQLPPDTPQDPAAIVALLTAAAPAEAEITRETISEELPPVITIATGERVTMVTYRFRGRATDLIAISGPADRLGPGYLLGPEYLAASCATDYARAAVRLRATPPHLYDVSGHWQWASDLAGGILVAGLIDRKPVLVGIQRVDALPREARAAAEAAAQTAGQTAGQTAPGARTAPGGGPGIDIWTGVRLYRATDVPDDPTSAYLRVVAGDAAVPLFRITVLPADPDGGRTAPTPVVDRLAASAALRSLLEHGVILDDEEVPR